MLKDSYLAHCSHVFTVLFSIVITSLGEERAGLYASRALVCLSCMRYYYYFFFCIFLFLFVSGRLRIVIVALTGLCI